MIPRILFFALKPMLQKYLQLLLYILYSFKCKSEVINMLIKELAAQRVCLYLILRGRLDRVLDQEEVLPFGEMERPTELDSNYQIVPCLQCSLTEILI